MLDSYARELSWFDLRSGAFTAAPPRATLQGVRRCISGGVDLAFGMVQEGDDGSSKFIFDLMEPERPKVDRAVLDFVKGHVFDPADFTIRDDGVCKLNPEMARMVVAMTTVPKI